MTKEKKRVCCNCGNNIRVKDAEGMVTHCKCDIDGHRIGYTECFEGWCRRWKRDRKWDDASANKKEDIEPTEGAKCNHTPGSKLISVFHKSKEERVAPHTGAWI